MKSKLKFNIQDYNAVVWSLCIIFSILVISISVYAVFPYKYTGELDCEADLGDLDMQYQQRFREEHPMVTRHITDGDGIARPQTFRDTNITEFKGIPIMLDINGVSGVKVHCKGKMGGTISHALLLGIPWSEL